MSRRFAVIIMALLLNACGEQAIKQVVNVQVVAPTANPSSSSSAAPSSSPSSTASPTASSAPVTPQPTITPVASASPQTTQCRYAPRADGSLEVPVNGQPRILLRGDYELLENGLKVKVTKPSQTDTGRVYQFICNNTNTGTITKICDKFPARNGELLVPYNGKDRYLKSNEYQVIADGKNSIRVTGNTQPDFGKVYTPPACA